MNGTDSDESYQLAFYRYHLNKNIVKYVGQVLNMNQYDNIKRMVLKYNVFGNILVQLSRY